MIIMRHEANTIRIEPNGDLVIPAHHLRQVLRANAGSDQKGLAEDLEDFGPGKLVHLDTLEDDQDGTWLAVRRDRRKEAAVDVSPARRLARKRGRR